MVRAKAKVRREEEERDLEALREHEEAVARRILRQEEKRSRSELPLRQVVNVVADEIQAVYNEMGQMIDDANARDKALTLMRHVYVHGGVRMRERKVPHVLCEEHGEG